MRLRTRLIISYTLVVLVAITVLGVLCLPLLQGYQNDRAAADVENDRKELASELEATRTIITQNNARINPYFFNWICNATNTKQCKDVTSPTREELTAAFNNQLAGKNLRIILIEPTTRQVLFDTETNASLELTGQRIMLNRPRDMPPTAVPGAPKQPTPTPSLSIGARPFQIDSFTASQGQEYDVIYTILGGNQLNLFPNYLNAKGDVRQLVIATLYIVPPVPNVVGDLGFVMGIAGLIAIAVALVAGGVLSRGISRPLSKATIASQAVARGDYSHTLPLKGSYELVKLAESFNHMQQEVEEYQRMQRDLIGSVSHELKTPLTAIQGFSQAMLDGALRTPDDFSFAAGIINKETERMIRLVHSLLELSKLESGQVKMAQDRVQIEEIVGDTLSSFEPQAQQKSVIFVKKLYPVPPMLGDHDRLRQVFNNLLDNALRYTPAGGSVTVSTRSTNANIVITVSDTGLGIAPEDLPHIFERFYQADKSRSKEAGGLGLGLAICKEIIAAHQGKIEVYSTPNKGTTFTIILPATPLNFEQSPQTPTAEPVTRH